MGALCVSDARTFYEPCNSDYDSQECRRWLEDFLMPDASEAYIDRILQTRGSRRVAHATHFYPWHFYKTNKMVRRYPWAEPTRSVRQFDVVLTTRMSPEQRVTQRHMKHIDDVC